MVNARNWAKPVLLAALLALALTPAGAQAQKADDFADVRQYIAGAWDELTRSPRDCATYADLRKKTAPPVLYLPAGMAVPAAVRELQRRCPLEVRHLPQEITRIGELDLERIREHGLLYLEHPYVVPGGFFNEMYGWDSYFILRGLLRDGRVEMARGMVENFFFQIEHYGGILNANRTYFLSRSQPPFLTSMILAVHDAEKSRGRDADEWLELAYGHAVKDHELWTSGAHLAGKTGLSRYYDFGEGPTPDILAMEDQYYGVAAMYFLRHPQQAGPCLAAVDAEKDVPQPEWPWFRVRLCDGEEKECRPAAKVALTAEFYKGDRSMRESGFDISHRFGPLSAGTHHFAAVCLNSLLYKAETDLARMASLLGKPKEAREWETRARERAERVARHLWNGERGLFFDYDTRIGTRSSYEYVTTFYPLWAGLASKEQAAAVMKNLALFEHAGGLAMSRQETRAQWDYPYGWAPIHLLAVEGMRRYGYHDDADRISRKFLSMVAENFRREGTIREKYDVVRRTTETRVEAGYKENVVGFGWTNGVFLELLHGVEAREKKAAAGSKY